MAQSNVGSVAAAPAGERDTRQRGLVPPAELARTHAVVVGVGAVGRQVALQLAAMGLPRLTLVDHDRVEEVNLGPQGWLENDIGRLKVNAAAEQCSRLNLKLSVSEEPTRFRRSHVPEILEWPGGVRDGVPTQCVVFCCVDSMEARRLVFDTVLGGCRLFVDGRMSAETIRVLAAHDDETRAHYATTLFSDAEAHQGACTARSTIYTSNIAAGLMVHALAVTLRGQRPVADQLYNLLAAELTVVKD